jgi:hypothetical protein
MSKRQKNKILNQLNSKTDNSKQASDLSATASIFYYRSLSRGLRYIAAAALWEKRFLTIQEE